MRRIGNMLVVWLLLFCTACYQIDPWPVPDEGSDYDEVVVFYVAGYFPGSNDLSPFLRKNLEDVRNGFVPDENSRKALVTVTHFTDGGREDPPRLVRMYSKGGTVISDTLKTYPLGMTLASSENMESILADVKELFPSDHYGMIFSSHASGWTPVGYYYSPSDFEPSKAFKVARRPQALPHGAVPYYEIPKRPDGIITKSIGVESANTGGDTLNYEMDIEEFASSLPVHLDYIVFDACYMGCVEVAYALKDAVDYIVFSQTEIVGDGMCYPTMMYNLLGSDTPDLVQVCEDFYQLYASKSGWEQTCLVSLVDCSKLDTLASVTSALVSKYRNGIADAVDYPVQRFYCDDDKPFFFDFEDIFVAAGASPEDLLKLSKVVDGMDGGNGCILCAEHTDGVLADFLVDTFSGLSMYLPCHGTRYLNEYYRNLSWNQAVGLVQ